MPRKRSGKVRNLEQAEQIRFFSLLKRSAIVFQPTCGVPAPWITVRPMDHTAFFVPDIFAAKADTVAYLKSVDSRSDVDVVCEQQRLS